jgi:acetolactate synthase-1/2/3 large subunit
VFIVSNNAAWNIERLDQEVNYGGRVVGTTLAYSDYAAMARAFGLHAERVTDAERLPGGLAEFNDQKFALDLLERKHVLVAPGSSFNVPYRDHFRVTLLPDADQMADVFARVESLLDEYAAEG